MPGRYYIAFLFSIVLIWATISFGLDQALILKHADHGESHWRDKKLVTILEGDVQFVHDTMTLKSDRATWQQDEGIVVFEGQVSLQDTAQSLRARRLIYLQKEKKALADGQVTMVDSLNNLVLTAGHMEYEREKKITRAVFQPQLVIRREDGLEPVIIQGRHMELFSRLKEAVVADQVVISRGKLEVRCDRALYLDLEDRIILEGSPVAHDGKNELRGEKMVLYLEKSEITRIEVQGDTYGEFVQAADSTEGSVGCYQMTAGKMSFYLAQERVEKILAEGNVTSVYLPSGPDSSGHDRNVTSGDFLEIFMDQEKVERALVQGGALGYYVSSAKEGDAADTVKYGAQEIDYSLSSQEISLTGEASVDYGEIYLSAHKIVYDTRTEMLTAGERVFSPEQDTTGRGSPVLKEGEKELVGSHMIYNLRTQRGRVVEGQTEFEMGHFRGTSIRKTDEDVLKADHGKFTTCDLPENPHYYFYSRQMKIILKDKIIAKPVVLYIGRIPVMILPFWVFPIKPGRHSGLLIPRYGSSYTDGRYLRGLGYYFAPNQYWDATLSFDLYERTGWLMDLGGRYAMRYRLHGSIAGSYRWDERYSGSVLQKKRRWDLRVSHFQDITPSSQLQVRGTFIGEKDKSYYQDISYDPYQRMNRNLHSFLSLNKSWSGAKTSINLDHRWDMDSDVTTQYMPTISFQRFEAPLYRRKKKSNSAQTGKQPWYNSVYYRYSACFINSQKDWSEEEDGQTVDKHEGHQAVDQTLGLRVPLTLFGHLALTPSATYRETWFDRDKTGERYARRGDYDARVGATTTLYGLIQPHLGPLIGIRHVMKPSLNFSWRPDFEERDEYYAIPYIHSVGGPQKSLGMGLSNQFQIKLRKGDKERKYNVADLNFNTSCNFRAETKKLSNLSSSLRVHPSSNLHVTLGARHDFYEAESDELRLFSPRLLSFSIDTRVNLKGAGRGGQSGSVGKAKGWRMNLSHRYSESRSGGGIRKSSWLNGTVSFHPTTNWRVDYSGRYDIVDKEMVSQRIELYRDLHCWEARFVWEPTGIREGYYVRINIKAMKDIKLERIKGIRG
ncbi:hypothetical protein KAX22_02505 [bacterium]|nr:hypothetical protein [bacterium]